MKTKQEKLKDIDEGIKEVVGSKFFTVFDRENALYSLAVDLVISINKTEDGFLLSKITRKGKIVH